MLSSFLLNISLTSSIASAGSSIVAARWTFSSFTISEVVQGYNAALANSKRGLTWEVYSALEPPYESLEKERRMAPRILQLKAQALSVCSLVLRTWKPTPRDSVRMRMPVTRSANKENDISKAQCCSTLKLLITSGHVRLYTWQTGHAADQWGPDDDWVLDLLAQEQALQQSQCNEAEVILSLDVPQSIDSDTNEVRLMFETQFSSVPTTINHALSCAGFGCRLLVAHLDERAECKWEC
ncbi:unnamed protein product [Echinostoma caproni]|uniref:Eph LBD domain-containing protein n=1 Tax=Echinostoma caproni TaxID=27848 RepID=A0A183AR30_9TREM|nr:unnamed protein product [Echinostoma caproni]